MVSVYPILRSLGLAVCVLVSSVAMAFEFDPSTVKIESKQGWGRIGNAVQIFVDGELLIEGSGTLDLSYDQVELIRDFLRLQVKMAKRGNRILEIFNHDFVKLREGNPSAKDLASIFKVRPSDFDKIRTDFYLNIMVDTSGAIYFKGDDKIYFEEKEKGLQMSVNGEIALLIPMSNQMAKMNRSHLNLKASDERRSDLVPVLSLRNYKYNYDAGEVFNKSFNYFLD